MADIGKINAVALANIAKLDAVLAANLAKVNGLVFASAPAIAAPLAAYSVRLLDTAVGVPTYTGSAMRVREDSGDTETDIGFDTNGDLDTAAIATHCGTASGFVVSWVDQSGNANDADQSTLASQPQIYDGTAVITDNGKPAIRWDGTNDQLLFTTATATTTCFIVQKTSATVDLLLSSTTVNNSWHFFMQDGNTLTDTSQWRTASGDFGYKNGTLTVTEGTTTRDQVHTAFADGIQNLSSWIGLDNAAADDYVIGSWFNGSLPYEGDVQEIILYNTDQSSNRTDIEENINSEYLIYQPTDAPTSGLLADYTGAAAAYSVRQLSDKAVIALKVRRDSDDVEQNFGFDSNGDLDTAGIAAFCGTANGYVTRWWDQSTNGNHADQATDTSQPQIYNGTAVIIENGKPALDFDATNTYFQANGFADDFNGADIEMSFFATAAPQAAANQLIWGIRSSTGTADWQVCYLRNTPNIQVRKIDDANTDSGSTRTGTYSNQQNLFSATSNGTTETVYVNGSAQVSNADIDVGTCTFDVATIGASATPSVYFNGTMQELIIYAANQSSNRTDIETDIDTYFSIT